MSKENIIAINVDLQETRVAIIENGMIAELLVERIQQKRAVGNIYRGRVTRVLPGMQAAFVDIGLEKHAFLHASDVVPEKDAVKKNASIKDFLKEGQYLPVQVSKDMIGTKGCRITSDVSLAGRHLVYMPLSKKGGISRKIEDEKERSRLQKVMSRLKTSEGAMIARTAAMGASPDALEADVNYLVETWQDIIKKHHQKRKPCLLYEELSLPLKVVRDKFNDSIAQIIVDSSDVYDELRGFIDRLIPRRLDAVALYSEDEPIFDAFGIESEIKRALERVVELPSGGSLVIDQGEALTAVDVNTGKFVGKGSKDQEETIFQTNLEAVEEIAYQVRFRNIGGLIVLDLIDMDKSSNRQKVTNRLKEILKGDRAKTSVNDISRFGLIEMTRERTSESLGRMLHEPCPYCDGTGSILSKVTIASEVLREIQRRADDSAVGSLEAVVHPGVASELRGPAQRSVKELSKRIGKKIKITEDKNGHMESYHVYSRKP
ncbi:MAG: Rne/Rng family ribonuclease [Deltaproteobacteria bacterium]|nr:Rne/Rng family ribonuclease [Deltaproteobacteria bacterium]MBN2670833.1 Rne/Rng family ribonuclease [Deltaproteobacteria bacterium]